MDILTFFAMLLPAVDEQVIVVPKFIQEVTPQRLRPPEPQQLVEQLVEVPTIVSFSSLQRIMDQTVDIPAPRGRGRGGGLQDFSQDSSTAAADDDIPVPRGDLQGFLPGQGFTASSSLSGTADEAGQGVFRTFPHGKKVRSAGQVSADLPRHVSPWTPSAYDVSMGPDEEIDELLAIPMELRTPAQRARLFELISASCRVRRRKRKKRRKKKAQVLFLPILLRPIYSGRCLLPFLRQSGGHSCYACRDVYPQCKLCRCPSFLQVLFLDSVSAWHWWCRLWFVTQP